MTIEYRKATLEDAELLIDIYNASFYSDYLRYGTCPGYGNSKEMMEESIRRYPKHIILSDNVNSVYSNAFEGCSGLKHLTIGSGVTSVGNYAFQNCNSLETVMLNCMNVGTWFKGMTSIKEVTMGDNVASITASAFQGCSSLESIIIPNNVTSIKNNTFDGCSKMTSATIGSGVETIGSSAFSGCSSLQSIVIPNGVTSMGDNTFNGCKSMTTATIGNGVSTIGSNVFKGCSSLLSIVIPNSVTSIGNNTFEGCSSMTSATIGCSVKSIGTYAFKNCSSLTEVVSYNTTPPLIVDNTFDADTYANAILKTREGFKKIYWLNPYWEKFSNMDEVQVVTYTLTYMVDGELYQSFELMEDEIIEAIEEPTKKGYAFSGWNTIPKRMPTHEVIVSGTFKPIINISQGGYATFYNENNSYVLSEGLSAQVVTLDTSGKLSYVTIAEGDKNGIIPKGVPVVLVNKDKTSGTYTLSSTTESASYSGDNLLHGSDEQTITSNVNGVSTSGNPNYVYYKLSYGKSNTTNADKLGWYWGAENGAPFSIEGGKAWLALPKSSIQSRESMLMIGDDATSINIVEERNMRQTNDAQYNIGGQRVGNNYKGIVIVNGKKIFRK